MTAEHLRAGRNEKLVVVVSAMSGVTDQLINTAQFASQQNSQFETGLIKIAELHRVTSARILNGSDLANFTKIFESDLKDLGDILRGVWLAKHLPDSTLDLVSGYGELWSSRILAAAWGSRQRDINPCWVDARKILVVTHSETGPQIDWQESQVRFDRLAGLSERMVVTGFIASTAEGVPTTLKRNGSDYSASIFGRLIKAKQIVIWTDVDGVYSADPRKVNEARRLDELSYEEAVELAYFGAKVIHPRTMAPAIDLQIPIWIKNTFRPNQPGTVIHKTTNSAGARGFTTVDHIALVNVEGTGMIGVPGIAQRLFGALREAGVSVILISQASSEHSICVAVSADQVNRAKSTLEKEFDSELRHGAIQTISVTRSCSIVALVGDGMVKKQGVSARFFSALSHAGVNVRAIAQGSSERNISAVIDEADSIRALRSTHAAFYLSDFTLSVGVVGTGSIGQAFLRQLRERGQTLRSQFNTDFRVRAVTNSKTMRLADEINFTDARELPADFEQFVAHVHADHLPHAVIVDCSASDHVADYYSQWLRAGIHVITPNKKAGAGSWSRYSEIQKSILASNRSFMYEATVGAGLPVISTLRDLLQTGDELISIEGLLSGTLSYIFSKYQLGTASFSEIVAEAKQLGYTEPDPRDDLSGLDVARKIVILGREANIKIELDNVKVKSLVPDALRSVAHVEEFMARLSEFDAEISSRRKLAQETGGVLRFVGSLDVRESRATAELRVIEKTHPFARVTGSDNMIAFRTKRYDKQPLIVQGPGAGPEVTAAGVFADLLRLARHLGARA